MRGEESELLLARIGDALEKREKGCVAVIPYVTPRARRQAERELRERGSFDAAWFFGGYPEAERTCLFLLPDYLTACLSSPLSETSADELSAWIGEELREAVSAVRITGSGYRVLSHRDYLGSILALGLERDAIGDVAVQNDHEAVVFCSRRMAGFLIESLTRVANDAVRCCAYCPDTQFTDGRHYRAIRETVASARLDCVVAALTKLSREEAQSAIRAGLVEVEFEPAERVDLSLTPPLTLSVRGYGRYILRGFDGQTRKGRLRLLADQLI